MLNDYFRYQDDIFNIESNFRCPHNCNAPGCWMADIIVETTLFDLIRLSRALNIPVSHLFLQYCSLGLATCEENIRYKRFLIKMKKPCPFLIDAKPLTKKLRHNHPKTHRFSLQDYDKLLDEILNSLNFSEHVMKKIIELDTAAGVKNLFGQRYDRDKMERLMGKATRPNIVYKLKRHHIKPCKRILHAPEVPFI